MSLTKTERIAEARALCRLFHFNTYWRIHMLNDWYFRKFGRYLLKICPECKTLIADLEKGGE